MFIQYSLKYYSNLDIIEILIKSEYWKSIYVWEKSI